MRKSLQQGGLGIAITLAAAKARGRRRVVRTPDDNSVTRTNYNIAMQKVGDNPEPDAVDKDFFRRLRGEVERQISGYVYQAHPGAMGTPLPADEIARLLNEMRLYLVEPRWEEVRLCKTLEEARTGHSLRRMCVTLAEDGGYVLVFDPVEEEYHLAWRSERGLGTWGVSGDAVMCFIAR